MAGKKYRGGAGAGPAQAQQGPAGPSRGPAEAQHRVNVREPLPGWCVREQPCQHTACRADRGVRRGSRNVKREMKQVDIQLHPLWQAPCWQSRSSVNTLSCQSFFCQGHQPGWDCGRLSLASLHTAIPPSWDQLAGKGLPCLVQGCRRICPEGFTGDSQSN